MATKFPSYFSTFASLLCITFIFRKNDYFNNYRWKEKVGSVRLPQQEGSLWSAVWKCICILTGSWVATTAFITLDCHHFPTLSSWRWETCLIHLSVISAPRPGPHTYKQLINIYRIHMDLMWISTQWNAFRNLLKEVLCVHCIHL